MKRTGIGRFAALVAVFALAAPAVAQANEVTVAARPAERREEMTRNGTRPRRHTATNRLLVSAIAVLAACAIDPRPRGRDLLLHVRRTVSQRCRLRRAQDGPGTLRVEALSSGEE
jgi:hypothetical protein